ncbi:hypothetical protein AVEN_251029-1, partial [Araneus ventricosus]
MYAGQFAMNSKIEAKRGLLRKCLLLTSYRNFDALLQHSCERQNLRFCTKRCNYLHQIEYAKEKEK